MPMCLAVPGRILEISSQHPPKGIVDLEGVRREVSLELVTSDESSPETILPADTPSAKVGDWVLVHVGFALSIVDEQEAQETLETLRKLGDMLDEEIAQVKASS